jgi:aspartokinase-like uncharacterized kinase
MWVVKLGGSLQRDAMLPQWLQMLASLGGGRVIIVCGGGSFADEVRRAQAHWRFADLPAHNMAVLAMMQTAYMAHGLNPALQLASTQDEIRHLLHGGHTVLWLPHDRLRPRPDADTNWDSSSDRIALDLARQLDAERFVVVKSCAIDPSAGLAELSASRVLDRHFCTDAENAAFPIEVIHKDEIARMRELLAGKAA